MAEEQSWPERAAMIEAFTTAIPHVVELGVTADVPEPGQAVMRLPYQERLVGNPETGILHGGVVTTLVDTVSGLAVLAALDVPRTIATIDLRIDYLRPARPGEDLVAKADCYRVTHQVAFVRCVAYQGAEDDLVASAVGTFMIQRQPRRKAKPAPAKKDWP